MGGWVGVWVCGWVVIPGWYLESVEDEERRVEGVRGREGERVVVVVVKWWWWLSGD